MLTRDEMLEKVREVNGRRRERIATAEDIDIFIEELASAEPATRTVRVYPKFAFVPNNYKYRAMCTVLHAERTADGTDWNISIRAMDAKRPRGVGPRVTHNGR